MAIRIPVGFSTTGYKSYNLNGEIKSLSKKTLSGFTYMTPKFNEFRIRSIGTGEYNGKTYTSLDSLMLDQIIDAFNKIFQETDANNDEKKMIHIYRAITASIKYISDLGGQDRMSDINHFFYNNGGDCEDWSFVIAKICNMFGMRSGVICLWDNTGMGHAVPWAIANGKTHIMERAEFVKSIPSHLISIPYSSPGTYSDLTVFGVNFTGEAVNIPKMKHPALGNFYFMEDMISAFELDDDYLKPMIMIGRDSEADLEMSTIYSKHQNHPLPIVGSHSSYSYLTSLTGYRSINRELLFGGIAAAIFLLIILGG